MCCPSPTMAAHSCYREIAISWSLLRLRSLSKFLAIDACRKQKKKQKRNGGPNVRPIIREMGLFVEYHENAPDLRPTPAHDLHELGGS